ncbi:MAG: SDR family oxidoreductase [Myxococcales bacterium]|nr:SDR family oxidoreductase [Myxococcales bacterium]
MSKILVTGATGTIGGAVLEALLVAGAEVRVGVRNTDKAVALRDRGAETVTFDYDRPETLEEAMRGASTLFLLTPLAEDPVPYARLALQAAKQAGIQHVVRLSVVGADANGIGPGRHHGVCDELIKESGLGWTLLAPTFFQDNVLNYTGGSIQRDNAFYGAAGDGKISYVSARDIGEVGAKVLMAPQDHAGQTYVLTGPEALSENEVAQILSGIVGRDIHYVNLSPEQYAGGMRSNGLPEWLIKDLLDLEQIKANGWAEAVAHDVEKVLGRPALRMKDYLATQKARLA